MRRCMWECPGVPAPSAFATNLDQSPIDLAGDDAAVTVGTVALSGGLGARIHRTVQGWARIRSGQAPTESQNASLVLM